MPGRQLFCSQPQELPAPKRVVDPRDAVSIPAVLLWRQEGASDYASTET